MDMENALIFDTLAYSKTLQEAGVPRSQADACTIALKRACDEISSVNNLATKADLAETKASLIKWLVGLTIALAAFQGALIIVLYTILPTSLIGAVPTP